MHLLNAVTHFHLHQRCWRISGHRTAAQDWLAPLDLEEDFDHSSQSGTSVEVDCEGNEMHSALNHEPKAGRFHFSSFYPLSVFLLPRADGLWRGGGPGLLEMQVESLYGFLRRSS